MRLVPINRAQARVFVAAHHRHLGAPVGDVIRVGLEVDGALVAVAMAGRPVARGCDDGATLEVTRVAVAGAHPGACSRLYGAIGRAAGALGWRRLITYTRADEPGVSPRAAGFSQDAEVVGRGWVRSEGPTLFGSPTVANPIAKVRWVRHL